MLNLCYTNVILLKISQNDLFLIAIYSFAMQIRPSPVCNQCGKILFVTMQRRKRKLMPITTPRQSVARTRNSIYATADKSMEIVSKVFKFVVSSAKMESLLRVRFDSVNLKLLCILYVRWRPRFKRIQFVEHLVLPFHVVFSSLLVGGYSLFFVKSQNKHWFEMRGTGIVSSERFPSLGDRYMKLRKLSRDMNSIHAHWIMTVKSAATIVLQPPRPGQCLRQMCHLCD